MNTSSNNHDKNNDRKKPQLGTVQEVQQKLYAKNTTVLPYKRQGFSHEDPEQEVSLTWDELKGAKKNFDLVEKKKKKSKPLTSFAKILIASILFFAFSIAGAFMVFFYGQNEVSYNATSLAVRGPNSIAGGETLSFDISVINENPVPLILTDVVIHYPQGTITADSFGTPMDKDTASIDEIRSGFEDTVKFDAVLFGQEGETKDINIVFQYRIPGSDNLFFKERIYQVVIESSPVVISAKHEPTYQSGDPIEIQVTVAANATSPLRNMLLQLEYPFGFQFASASLSGLDDSTFLFPEILPGEPLELSIKGIIVGQDNEERAFRYSLGSQDPQREGVIASEFVETKTVLTIAKPAIGLQFAVESDPSILYVARSGDNLDFALGYTNTLVSKILDAQIVAKIQGNIFDQTQVKSNTGFYRSSDESITWTQSEQPDLASIESSESGQVGFALQLVSADLLAGKVENPEMLVEMTAEATSFEEGGSKQKVQQTINKRITVATDVAVAQKLLYSEGPLTNTGPIQPTVGQTSTYTLQWQVANTTNKITDVQVSAVLPPYVAFTGVVAPLDQAMTFDPRTRRVTWTVPELPAAVGYTLPPKEVFFTVEIEPSLNQLDQSLDVVGDIQISAQDSFTNIQVVGENRGLNSRITDDPQYFPGQARVTQ